MQEIYERIDRYLDNQMSPTEMDAFEAECRSNPELKETLLFQAAVRKEVIQSAIKKMDAHDGTIIPFKKTPAAWLYAVAAGILLLLLWNFLRTPSSSPLSSTELFAQSYEKPDRPNQKMGSGTSLSLKQATYDAYKDNQFEEARNGFEKLISLGSANDTLAFYRAICVLELNQVDEAIAQFSQISTDNIFWEERTAWYLALAYLKKGERETATTLIREIATDEGNSFQPRAERYLKLLSP